jgi:addiction module HigA family antidote
MCRKHQCRRTKTLKPIAPGELLREEFREPMKLSALQLAKHTLLPVEHLRSVLSGARTIDADLDRKLCEFFGLSNGYWLRAQSAHDQEVAAQ